MVEEVTMSRSPKNPLRPLLEEECRQLIHLSRCQAAPAGQVARAKAAARGWNTSLTPFVWGGKRAARRQRTWEDTIAWAVPAPLLTRRFRSKQAGNYGDGQTKRPTSR
jgi:hypothetical protein